MGGPTKQLIFGLCAVKKTRTYTILKSFIHASKKIPQYFFFPHPMDIVDALQKIHVRKAAEKLEQLHITIFEIQ